MVLLAGMLQATDYSAEGLKALEDNKYLAAAEWFTQAVAADPKDYSAHFHLALANSLLGKNAEAAAGYRRALELKPDLYEAQVNLGLVLLRLKQPDEAAGVLRQALARKPGEFAPNLYMAQALLDLGDAAGAERRFAVAAGLDPKSADAQLGLARSRAAQGRLEEAVEGFQRAVELDPALTPVLLELASLYESKGKRAEAIALYAKFPEDVAARERMGELLIEEGRAAEAAPHLEWVVARSPTPASRLALATAYVRAGQKEKAVSLFEEVIAAEPADMRLRLMYGRLLRDLKRYPAAAEQFRRVADGSPESAEAWSELAGVLILLEEYPEALAALDRLKALGAEEAGHYYLRAIMLDRMRQLKPALENYRRFLELSNGQAPNEEFRARARARIIEKELKR